MAIWDFDDDDDGCDYADDNNDYDDNYVAADDNDDYHDNDDDYNDDDDDIDCSYEGVSIKQTFTYTPVSSNNSCISDTSTLTRKLSCHYPYDPLLFF